RHIPAHSYDLQVHVSRQVPESLGRVDAQTVITGAVDELDRESYYVLRASAGESFIGEVTGDIDIRAGVYDYLYGAMTLLGEHEDDRLVWRSFEGESALLGVADAAGVGGSFELTLSPLSMLELGPVTQDAGFGEFMTLPAGTSSQFYRLDLESPGMATVDVNGDLGLAATVRGLDLAIVRGPTPLPASFDVLGNEEGIFLEIGTMDGSPLPADANAGLNATLEPPLSHQPSIGRSDSLFIEPPVAVAGTLEGPDDVHWVRFEVTDPVRFQAAVLPRGNRGPGNTALAIYDEFGNERASNYDGGPGSYSRLDLNIELEGTFYLGLLTMNEEPGDYILEVLTEVLR
ncbi:MAG: hypothetical protein ACOCVR_01670, partial [Myxococcota bacterium]